MKSDKHLVICGYGLIGAATAKAALASWASNAITIIEADEEQAQEARKKGFNAVTGDASCVATLRVAQVGIATDLIVCIDAPVAEKIVHLARSLSSSVRIQAALSQRNDRDKLMRAGAHDVVVISKLAGELIADTITG